ncbi:MAG: hypothetical protein ABI876_17020 [Bacteroidota bacterium]
MVSTMSVESVSIALRGWASDGRIVAGDDFLLPLNARLDPPVVRIDESAGVWRSVVVSFLDNELAQFGHYEEPTEAFAEAVSEAFGRFAVWLSDRDPAVFDELRSQGITIDVSVSCWIEESQFSILIPPLFLLECGKRGLAIDICTND